MVDPEPEALRQARRRWAELLRRILEVDPLACPLCGEDMRIVAFITAPKQIDRDLEHLIPRVDTFNPMFHTWEGGRQMPIVNMWNSA